MNKYGGVLFAVLLLSIATAVPLRAQVYIHGTDNPGEKAFVQGPELYISDVCNDSGIVKFEVTNGGSSKTPSNFFVGLYADKALVEEVKITETLYAKGSSQGQFTKPAIGKTIVVCADSQDDIDEPYEDNNCETVTDKCPIPSLPDLEITQVYVNSGKACFTLKNSGNAVAPKGVKVGLMEGQNDVDDYVLQNELSPGSTIEECFDYELAAPDTNPLTVCADSTAFVEESDENNNCKTYYPQQQDTQAPTITKVTVGGIGTDSVTISWTTDEDADSTVKYGSTTGVFDQEASETASVTNHTVALTGLSPKTTYNFFVQSKDAAGNAASSSEHFFTTTAQSGKAPAIDKMFPLAPAGGMFPMQFEATIPEGVVPYKVEFSIDGKMIATDYSEPFNCWFNPAALAMNAESLLGDHNIVGTIYNADGVYTTVNMDWLYNSDCFNGLSEVDILYVSPDEIYSETDPASSRTLEVWIRATESVWTAIAPGLPRLPGASNSDLQLVNDDIPDERLSFYLDGTEVAATYVGPEPYLEDVRIFSFTSGALDWDTHRVEVRGETSEGCRLRDFESIEVAQTQPDIWIGLTDVRKSDSSLVANFTIRNRGTGTAVLDRASQMFNHFQAYVTSTPDNYTVAHTYYTGTRNCYLSFSFDPGTTLAPGESKSIGIRAVPILYPETEFSDFDMIGAESTIHYNNDDGTPFYEEYEGGTIFICNVTCDSTVEETVEECISNADYLAVTSPTNLYGLYRSDQAESILRKTAEITAKRGGVLGYFDGYVPTRTAWRSGDPSALGNIFSGRGREYVFGDISENAVRVYYTDYEESLEAVVPIEVDMYEGDRIAAGNVFDSDDAGNMHYGDEIVLVRGSGHDDDAGEVSVYAYDYMPGSGRFSTFTTSTGFETGYGMAVGDILGSTSVLDNDEIAIALGEYGQVHIYDFHGGTATPDESFSSAFRTGDFFDCGRVVGMMGDKEELVVGSVSDDRIYVYGRATTLSDYSQIASFSHTLEADDDFEVGDIYGNNMEEIVIADKSADRIYIYAYDSADSAFEQVSYMDINFHEDYPVNIELGDKLGRGKPQITVWWPRGRDHYHTGEIHAFMYYEGYSPADRYSLDALVSQGGAWEQKLQDNWDSEGYLLIVGENRVVPTAGYNVDLPAMSYGRITYTDRYYESTTPSNAHRPNIAFGRMICDNADRLLTLLQTTIDVIDGTVNFDTSDALLCSGHMGCPPGDCDNINFTEHRDRQHDILDDDYDFVNVRYHTSIEGYNRAVSNPDFIALNGHGSVESWDGISRDDILAQWDIGTGHPIVVAGSCLTGAYGDGYSLAEAYLAMGCSAYVGATEVSIFPWGGRMVENFTSQWTHRDAGQAMKHAKRHRWTTNTYAWDWPINRYTIAIHHLYGDPKLEPVRTRSARAERADSTPPEFKGPLDSFSLSIPDYAIYGDGNSTSVNIPGGDQLLVLDRPKVPTYTATLEFPAGYMVQDVTLNSQTTMSTLYDLELDDVSAAIAGWYKKQGRTEGAGWWPDQDFVWESAKNPDGSTTVSVTVFPLYYNKTEKEGRYYKDYTFGVEYIETDIGIDSIFVDKPVHAAGDEVEFDLYVMNSGETAADVVIESKIRTSDGTYHGLPLKTLAGLKGLGSYTFNWDSTGSPKGLTQLFVTLRDNQSNVLDKADREFDLGLTAGKMSALTADKQSFSAGDSVGLTTKFLNTGTQSLSGTIYLEVTDAKGAVLSSYAGDYSDLPVGSEASLNQTWKSSKDSGDCTVKAYADFNGRLSDIRTLTFPAQAYQGWWYNPDAAGSGLSLDVSGDVLFLAWYAYDEQGEAAWWVAWAQKGTGNTYTGELRQYTGWPLGQSWAIPEYKVIGSVTLSFSSFTAGTLNWDLTAGGSGSMSIKKYLADLVPDGSKDPRDIGGWYIDERYPGMGFFLEAYGETLYLGWYHYDEESTPRWWVLGGWNHVGEFASSDTSFKGSFMEFSGGQTPGGTYTAPSQVPGGDGGELSVSPDGSAISLTWDGKTTYELTPYQISMP